MSDARFRELLQRLDTGPEEPRPEFASELWSKLERELQDPAATPDGEAVGERGVDGLDELDRGVGGDCHGCCLPRLPVLSPGGSTGATARGPDRTSWLSRSASLRHRISTLA